MHLDRRLSVLDLAPSPSPFPQLILYALFKQGTVGDVNTSRPGVFDLKGKAKWDSWEKQKGAARIGW